MGWVMPVSGRPAQCRPCPCPPAIDFSRGYLAALMLVAHSDCCWCCCWWCWCCWGLMLAPQSHASDFAVGGQSVAVWKPDIPRRRTAQTAPNSVQPSCQSAWVVSAGTGNVKSTWHLITSSVRVARLPGHPWCTVKTLCQSPGWIAKGFV